MIEERDRACLRDCTGFSSVILSPNKGGRLGIIVLQSGGLRLAELIEMRAAETVRFVLCSTDIHRESGSGKSIDPLAMWPYSQSGLLKSAIPLSIESLIR